MLAANALLAKCSARGESFGRNAASASLVESAVRRVWPQRPPTGSVISNLLVKQAAQLPSSAMCILQWDVRSGSSGGGGRSRFGSGNGVSIF